MTSNVSRQSPSESVVVVVVIDDEYKTRRNTIDHNDKRHTRHQSLQTNQPANQPTNQRNQDDRSASHTPRLSRVRSRSSPVHPLTRSLVVERNNPDE